MKRLFILAIVVCAMTMPAATLVIEGKYQNRNLYVHNGFGNNGVGFCTKEIRVNGVVTTDETNSSAFEIDLRALQLKYGDSVIVEIEHSDGCMPHVLNIEDLKPKPTFETLAIHVSNDGILTWKTNNESGPLPYIIEQFRWNKWSPIGVVYGIGTPDEHTYTFRVTMHSGENRYRVRQKGLNYVNKISRETRGLSNVNKPSFAIPPDYSRVDFSDNTGYEVYDVYGQVVARGYGKSIDIKSMPPGDYHLCFDNQVTEFKKLRVKSH